MDLFVVLATYAREKLLARTLASLAECRLPTGYRGTLVIENGARGGTESIVRGAAPHLHARYAFEPVGNKSRALNAGLAGIDEGLLVFLDDDVRLSASVLELYAEAAARAGRGHFFGGPVGADYEEAPPRWVIDYLPPSARGWTYESSVDESKTPAFLGFNWAVFVEDIRRLGGFDENFGPGSKTGSVGQETQMQRRLIAAGVRPCYVADALVHHWVPTDRCSPAFALDRAYRDGIKRGLLKRDYFGPIVSGYPIVLGSRMVGRWMRWQLTRVSASRERQFASQFAYYQMRGVVNGVSQQLQQRRSADPAALSGAAPR